MNKSATKWNGIKAMLDFYNCSYDEAAYFGDDYDDIEPMKMCGLGIAVSNAIDEVKAVADYIVEDNDSDGVAKFIEQRLLSFVLGKGVPFIETFDVENREYKLTKYEL